ncbi:MAG: PAAR domain-containing protein [Pseudomonadota bacterium]
MTLPQARMTDVHSCLVTAGIPMPIIGPCSLNTLVQGLPAARLTDTVAGIPPVPHPIIKGSMTCMIGMLPAARISDTCVCTPGPVALGCFTVLTGG